MNINELILNIEKKLKKEIPAEKIEIQDKTYMHKTLQHIVKNLLKMN